MKNEIWVFIFILGLIIFGWPIISIFKENLYIYFFLIWPVFIALIYFSSVYAGKRGG